MSRPRPCRSPWLTVIALLAGMALLTAACGGDDDNSSTPAPSGGAATPTKASEGDGDGGDSGGKASPTAKPDNSGGDASTLEKIEKDLVPPKSKQISRFSTDDGTLVSYESTESLSSLKDYYDKRLKELKLKVQGSLDVTDSHSWFIGDDDNKGPQVSVMVAKSGDDPTVVNITLSRGD